MSIRWSWLCGVILFFSCGKKDVDWSQINNLNGNQITVMGHAGMGIASQFPLNSFESLQSALSLGTDGVEMDIQMTRDSVLVLFHDATLEEQTNLEGRIYEKDWDEIKQAIYKNPPFAEYRILSLEQFFENVKDIEHLYFSLDFKLYEPSPKDIYYERYCSTLLQLIDQYDLAQQVLIEARDTTYLRKIKSLRPDLKIFLLETFEEGFDWARKMDLYGMIMNNESITAEEVQQVHDAGLRISLFGVLSKDDHWDAIEKSPDFLQTDKVKYAVKILK